jgi:hypothetical protein
LPAECLPDSTSASVTDATSAFFSLQAYGDPGNAVPCCTLWNYMKSFLDEELFLRRLQSVMQGQGVPTQLALALAVAVAVAP